MTHDFIAYTPRQYEEMIANLFMQGFRLKWEGSQWVTYEKGYDLVTIHKSYLQ